MRRLFNAAAGAALFCSGAISGIGQAAPPEANWQLPPYEAAYTPQGVDERGLWMEMDEEERKLRDSRFMVKDPELVGYIRSVLCRTVGEERCRNVRLYIQHTPEFNATMAPNGMMLVNTGLLLRVRSEAELASVLGHEFGHFELRHSLQGFKRQRAAGDLMTWAQILAPNSSGAFQSGVVGAFFAFNRAQEKEADLKGLSYLAASPYPSSVAPNIWERLMAEQDATGEGRKRKVTHSRSASFSDTHPSDLTRATYLREEAAKIGDKGDVAEAAYRSGMAKWLPVLLDDQVKLNDFGGTEFLLKMLAGDSWTADLLYSRAELYRQRGNPRDLVSAAQFYQEAIDKGCAIAEARRGLGLALLRSQQVEQGRAALRQYLSEKPDATDASMIAMLIAN